MARTLPPKSATPAKVAPKAKPAKAPGMRMQTAAPLGRLLKRVHMKGLITDALLEVSGGVGTIQAVDLTNIVYLRCVEQLQGLPDMVVGLSNIGMVCKFLEDTGDKPVSFTVDEKWLTVKSDLGHIKVLHLTADQVPTAVTDGDHSEELQANAGDVRFYLPKGSADALSYYMGLLSSNSIVLQVDGASVIARSSEVEDRQFSTPLVKDAERGGEGEGSFSIELFGSSATAILHTLDFHEAVEEADEDSNPVVSIAAGQPVVFTQDGCVWALTPVM